MTSLLSILVLATSFVAQDAPIPQDLPSQLRKSSEAVRRSVEQPIPQNLPLQRPTEGFLDSLRATKSQTLTAGGRVSVGPFQDRIIALEAKVACALLTKAEIQKETGLMVADATPGKPVAGVLGRCTWDGPGNWRVILTLVDAQHMGLTLKAQQQTGGEDIKGLGSTAVGSKGAGFTGGGYTVSVLDVKGGFGVSILGKDGTRERAIALAKVVESHR